VAAASCGADYSSVATCGGNQTAPITANARPEVAGRINNRVVRIYCVAAAGAVFFYLSLLPLFNNTSSSTGYCMKALEIYYCSSIIAQICGTKIIPLFRKE
jgi:hypothetical protein